MQDGLSGGLSVIHADIESIGGVLTLKDAADLGHEFPNVGPIVNSQIKDAGDVPSRDHRCVAQTNITGVVVDVDGKAMAGVGSAVSGFPQPSGGRIHYRGVPRFVFTDSGVAILPPHGPGGSPWEGQ